MGLLPLFGWKLQMVMVVLPVIMLAVANDYGIHLMAKYQEDNRPGAERESKALAKGVLKSLGLPTITAGVTTMAGLLCLTTHIIIPAQQMGVLAAIGVGFAICGSLMFIPAVLAILPVPEPLAHFGDAGKKGFLDRLLERVAEKVIAVPRGIIAVSVLLGLLACAGVMKVIVDTNPINYYPPNSPVAQTSSLINKHFGGSTELSIMLEGDIQDPTVLGRIDELDSRLKELPQVGTTSGINQVVRKMHMAVSDGDASADRIPDNKETVAQLFLLYSMGGDPDDFARMVDFGFERALLKIRINSLSTKGISEVVRASEDILETQQWDKTPIVGGFGAVFADLVEAVVKGQVASLLLSFLLVFLMVGSAFRSPVAGVFAVIPLGLAMPMLFGLMGVLGIELNVVTAMLSSIMIGVGVDYTIHFLWRFRDLRRMGTAPDKAVVETLTTTGRGIVFNALSVIIGFAVLLLSQFLPVQFFGFLVVISISACLIGALVLLPAICLVVQPKFLEPEV